MRLAISLITLTMLGCTKGAATNANEKKGTVNVVQAKTTSAVGDVLGIDLTLNPSQMMAKYKERNVENCFSSSLDAKEACLRMEAIGAFAQPKSAGAMAPSIKIEFYKGMARSLEYAVPYGQVYIDSAVTEGKKKYGQEPGIGWVQILDDGPVSTKYCILDFRVSEGLLMLMTTTVGSGNSGEQACENYKSEKDPNTRSRYSVDRVEWRSTKVVAIINQDYEVETKENADKNSQKMKEQSKTGTGL